MCSGGGYTKNNVARCWTNETAILVGEHLAEELPPNAYAEYYQPHNRLDRAVLSRKPLDNYNTRARIDEIRERCMEYLRHLAHTPGWQPLGPFPLLCGQLTVRELHFGSRPAPSSSPLLWSMAPVPI